MRRKRVMMSAVIRYQATGKTVENVKISLSFNNGKSWKEVILKAAQSFPIPGNTTNLLINNVPYDPKGMYEIRNGCVAPQ